MSRLLESDSAEQDSINIVQQDVWMNGAAAIALILFVVIALARAAAAKTEDVSIKLPPGSVTVQTYWPDNLDADVDLWVKGPTGDPVGYSNKGGANYNLLRDDLGIRSAEDPNNSEMTTSRGLTVGVNCVNLHLFRNNSKTYPIPVKVTITIVKGDGNGKSAGAPNLVSDVELEKEGQEINVFCFIVDKDGNIPEGEKGIYQSNSIHLRSSS